MLGEDDRLVSVLRQRVTGAGRFTGSTTAWRGRGGHRLVKPGGQRAHATVAAKLAERTQWAGTTTAFATRPDAAPAEAVRRLRRRGARRVVIAPWFLAPGLLPDRVRAYAQDAGIPMALPLGAHELVAATVLDRFDQTAAERIAA